MAKVVEIQYQNRTYKVIGNITPIGNGNYTATGVYEFGDPDKNGNRETKTVDITWTSNQDGSFDIAAPTYVSSD